tara:strand:+ start:128 stop:676 length:549 start_codon:yes stop_codon:yes gene_type:complete
MSGIDDFHLRAAEKRRNGSNRFVGFQAETSELRRFINAVSGDKEGRKVIRNASRAALEVFNDATAERAGKLPLKKSGKGWRKMLKKRSSYLYKLSATSVGKFSAETGINYKKATLRISHLVERGFRHFTAGKVSGNWFRMEAYVMNRERVMRETVRNMQWGWEQVAKTGKAPTAAQTRKNFK